MDLSKLNASMAKLNTPAVAVTGIRKFLLPSAPCSITLPNGIRCNAPDGIISVDYDSQSPGMLMLREHMEEMLSVGNCSVFYSGDPVSKSQIPSPIQAGGVVI